MNLNFVNSTIKSSYLNFLTILFHLIFWKIILKFKNFNLNSKVEKPVKYYNVTYKPQILMIKNIKNIYK